MAKFDGGAARVTFGGTNYDCIVSSSLNSTASDITAECSSSSGSVTHRSAGTPNHTLTFDHLVESQDTTTLAAFEVGTSGALEWLPEGGTSGNISVNATTAYVTNRSISVATASMAVMSVTLGIDGAVTIAAEA